MYGSREVAIELKDERRQGRLHFSLVSCCLDFRFFLSPFLADLGLWRLFPWMPDSF